MKDLIKIMLRGWLTAASSLTLENDNIANIMLKTNIPVENKQGILLEYLQHTTVLSNGVTKRKNVKSGVCSSKILKLLTRNAC